MFNSFLEWLFHTFTYFFSLIIDFVSRPFLLIFRQFLPQLDDFFIIANNFITNYIFKGLQFAKMLFINFFHINHAVFEFCLILLVISTSLFFSTRLLRLVANLWSIKNNGRSKN